jgi:phosphomevalonate kinase
VRVAAPGKLLLTGAYAVLEGAPAIVVAVDRYAVADTSREHVASIEVREALRSDVGPAVDTTALHDGASKLGLGSSAASLVATLGAVHAERGDDLASTPVRNEIFMVARAAHDRAQRGGSGVDVAASVYGGVLRYQLHRGGGAEARPVSLPPGVAWSAFWSGTSARTSDLRARVDALRAKSERVWREAFQPLVDASEEAARACDAADSERLLDAATSFGAALAGLGHAADAPIVPRAFAELAALALAEGAAFYPSGAGGGDVGVFLGRFAPSERFISRATDLAMHRLGVSADRAGVHRVQAL